MNKIVLFIIILIGLLSGIRYILKPWPVDTSKIAIVNTWSQFVQISQSQSTYTYTLLSGQFIKWLGRKVWWSHVGTLTISDWFVNMSGDSIVWWEIMINMESLESVDLTWSQKKELESSLKKSFFDTNRYKTARIGFVKNIWSWVILNITLKGITNQISVPLRINKAQNTISLASEFFVDRTKRGINELMPLVDTLMGISFDIQFKK